MQLFNATSYNIVARNVLHTFGQPVTTCCNMLDGVGSSLKMVKFLLQQFWMSFATSHNTIQKFCKMLC